MSDELEIPKIPRRARVVYKAVDAAPPQPEPRPMPRLPVRLRLPARGPFSPRPA